MKSLIGRLEPVEVNGKTFFPEGHCAIGSGIESKTEIWWCGELRHAPERSKEFPKADRIVFHGNDETALRGLFEEPKDGKAS